MRETETSLLYLICSRVLLGTGQALINGLTQIVCGNAV